MIFGEKGKWSSHKRAFSTFDQLSPPRKVSRTMCTSIFDNKIFDEGREKRHLLNLRLVLSQLKHLNSEMDCELNLNYKLA